MVTALMATVLTNDPTLTCFRQALGRLYRLERVVLYGSRARGDSRPRGATEPPLQVGTRLFRLPGSAR